MRLFEEKILVEKKNHQSKYLSTEKWPLLIEKCAVICHWPCNLKIKIKN